MQWENVYRLLLQRSDGRVGRFHQGSRGQKTGEHEAAKAPRHSTSSAVKNIPFDGRERHIRAKVRNGFSIQNVISRENKLIQ